MKLDIANNTLNICIPMICTILFPSEIEIEPFIKKIIKGSKKEKERKN